MSTAKKTWFTVEIVFDYGSETKRFHFANCNSKTVHQLRATLLQEGIQIPTDAKTWVIIFPWNVRTFTSTLQEKFYYDIHSDANKTVFLQDQTLSNGQ